MANAVPNAPAAWTVSDLAAGHDWVFEINDRARSHLAEVAKAAYVPDKALFDYTRDDIDLGPARDTIAAAMSEALNGRGLALVRGLPRAGLSEAQFEILNWGIGLHTGVARPQGRASQYLAQVRNVGTDYRSASGRGFSSNAKLDFHADGADLATLGCYNKARSGGQSMISSSLTVRKLLLEERPDLAEVSGQPFYFSRQNEEAPDETPAYGQPLFDSAGGRWFCRWNRNRVQSAQNIEDVPQLTAEQRETMDKLDELFQRPDVMFTMYIEPGDLQIMNNNVVLHSRTDFTDFEEPEKKRLLTRLWIAPPNSVRLPESWRVSYRSVEPGTVRGGIRGHNYDEACRGFDRRQAAIHGMSTDVA